MKIGIIALNQEDGKQSVEGFTSDQDFVVFSKPYHPVGYRLDGILETKLARYNKDYDEIKRVSDECVRHLMV
jgi:hypothetical protein